MHSAYFRKFYERRKRNRLSCGFPVMDKTECNKAEKMREGFTGISGRTAEETRRCL